MSHQSEYLTMIYECQSRRCNDWELDFLGDLEIKFKKIEGFTPTPRQLDKLNEIWEEKCQ